jgi:hypothetical protein
MEMKDTLAILVPRDKSIKKKIYVGVVDGTIVSELETEVFFEEKEVFANSAITIKYERVNNSKKVNVNIYTPMDDYTAVSTKTYESITDIVDFAVKAIKKDLGDDNPEIYAVAPASNSKAEQMLHGALFMYASDKK